MALNWVHIKLILMAAFWGLSFVAGRILAHDLEAFTISFYRFSLALIFFIPILLYKEGFPKLGARQLLISLALGLTGIFAYNYFFFTGLRHVPASRASLIIALNPIAIRLGAALFFKEALTFEKILGAILAFTGAGIIITRGQWEVLATMQFAKGELLILGCVASWTSYSLLAKRASLDLSPIASNTLAILMGTICLAFVSGKEATAQISFLSIEQWGLLLFLAFAATLLGFIWFFEGMNTIGAGQASIYINFVPVFSILFSWIFLGETLSTASILGGILVIVGVLVSQQIPFKKFLSKLWD